jgi:hypothetical protein
MFHSSRQLRADANQYHRGWISGLRLDMRVPRTPEVLEACLERLGANESMIKISIVERIGVASNVVRRQTEGGNRRREPATVVTTNRFVTSAICRNS